ncbi:MAG: RluA family pseudouridine synthase [Lachnospiraceae bacterium]|nr:RluA family pseudouridine synthase [Lachnospiraceae bacterium]
MFSEDIRQEFEVSLNEAGERLDKALSLLYPELSRSFFQKLIKEGQILVNELPRKANYCVVPGDILTVSIPKAQEITILPENIPLDILYEDEDVLVVNKPKGMVVHPSAGHYSGTLVNAVMYHCKDSLSGINGEIRPGIVHRIDMDTTGSLIVCKHDHAHVKIAEQIKEHSVTRRYLGITRGIVRLDEGVVDAPIGRHPSERKRMAANVRNGKPAVTHYRVLQRFRNHTFMEFSLETGRTHQIRVHMASIGHPLLGDSVYGNGKNPWKLQGQTLHAAVIGFRHPADGRYVEVEAPLPGYFEELLKKNL